MSSTRALWRVAAGNVVRRPLQSGLLVLGVALGVAVVVAIDIANASAVAAFQLTTQAVAGRATHRVVDGQRGLDETLYVKVREALGWRNAAPVVEGTVKLRTKSGDRASARSGDPESTGSEDPASAGGEDILTLLGVDPFAEPPFRSYLGSGGGGTPGGGVESAAGDANNGQSAADGQDAFSALLTRPGAVFLAEETASRAGLAAGDSFALVTKTGAVSVTLVGLLKPSDDLARRALAGLVLADISTAQELLGKEGRLDRIDLNLAPEARGIELGSAGARASEVARRVGQVAAVLPAGAAIVPASETTDALDGMTRAFRLNLTALSLLALLVGLLLIYNAMRFAVVQRRPVLATLRALGVTPNEVVGLILAEAAVVGVVGSAAGLALGVVLGRGMVALVTRTVSDLFFTLTVRGVPVPVESLVRGAVLGVVATTLAAWLPAREAASVPPALVRPRSGFEATSRRQAPLALGLAFAALGLAWLLLALPGNRVDLGFGALAAVVAAFALLAPMFTIGLMRAIGPVMARVGGTVGRMAPRNVTRSLSRTAVAVAALMVAVCVSIGVSLMVGSFRRTVDLWLAQTLTADVFITAQPDVGQRELVALDPAVIGAITSRPEVADWATAHAARLRAEGLGEIDASVLSRDIAATTRRYIATDGPASGLWAKMEYGAALITEPFSRFNGLGVGDVLALQSDRGTLKVPIVGVYYDYSSTRGGILLAERLYRANWDDTGQTSLALFLKPGASADALAADLRGRQVESDGHTPLAIESTAGIRREVFKVFDRAFSITVALQLLAIIVAFVGILSALFSLQLERTRELATLRTVGMTNAQLVALSLTETGSMGLAAGLLSWPAGLTLALILIFVVNRRSFGWTIQFTFLPDVFVKALALAVGAALLAGLLPALRLRSMILARALREE